MVSRQRDPALHLDANGDLSQAFRDRMRRQTPPSDEPGDALLAARVAALEDGLAVACAAIAHLKGLAESTSVAATAASAPSRGPLPLPLPNKRVPKAQDPKGQDAKGQEPKAETTTEWPPLMQAPPRQPPSTGSAGSQPRIRPPRPLATQLAPSSLHSQIEAFVSSNDEAVTRQLEARQAVFELIASRVRQAWPSAEVVCYGSMLTLTLTLTLSLTLTRTRTLPLPLTHQVLGGGALRRLAQQQDEPGGGSGRVRC